MKYNHGNCHPHAQSIEETPLLLSFENTFMMTGMRFYELFNKKYLILSLLAPFNLIGPPQSGRQEQRTTLLHKEVV